MKKIILITLFLCGLVYANGETDASTAQTLKNIQENAPKAGKYDRFLRDSNGEVIKDFSDSKFHVDGIHAKLGLSCNDCHLEKDKKDFSSRTKEACMKCHGDYEKISQLTGHLGYNDDPHKNPHYESLSCDTCHKTHQPSVNMCVRCHTQESMKKLIVK